MSTKYPDLFIALALPFESWEVKERPAPGGKVLHYVTPRSVMNRLDEVLGPENWWDTYKPGEKSVECSLTIVLPDGKQVTKVDAGGYAGMADGGDDDKSGYSDGLKRAAAKFGVARYLNKDGVPAFARGAFNEAEAAILGGNVATPQRQQAPVQRQQQQGQYQQAREESYEQAAPARQAPQQYQAPQESYRDEPRRPQAPQGNGGGYQGNGGAPRTGKALFAWTKEMEQKHEVGLLKYINSWAKLQEYPARMVDFDADQVALAYAEASRKIATLQPSRSEGYEDALAN